MSKYIHVDISNLFIEACKNSDIEQVEYLISMGANVNGVDYHGRNAAVLACATGDFQVMQVLLKHGADPNTRFYSIRRDLEHDIDHDPHHDAGNMSSPEFYEDEIWYDDCDFDVYDGYAVVDGDTLLHIAIHSDDPPMMRLLLDHGANVHEPDGDMHSPFCIAYESVTVGSPNQEAIDVLLDYVFKASFDAPGCCGYPLHSACANLDYPLIKRMLQLGADVNIIDKHTALGELLIAFSQCLKEVDMSALIQCVKVILEYGADVTIKDSEGKTVFDYVEAGSELEALLGGDSKPVLK